MNNSPKNPFSQFEQAINKLSSPKALPTIFIISTEETFFSDQLLKQFCLLIDKPNRAFGLHILDSTHCDIDQFMSLAQSATLLADKKAIWIKNAHLLPIKPQHNNLALSHLLTYAQNPLPTTIVGLCFNKKITKNKIISQLIDTNHVYYISFQKVNSYQLQRWLPKYAINTYELSLSEHTLEILIESVGVNLTLIDNELKKIKTSIGTKKNIDEHELKQLIGYYYHYTIFELADTLLGKPQKITADWLHSHLFTIVDIDFILRFIKYFEKKTETLYDIFNLYKKKMNVNQIQIQLGLKNTWYTQKLIKQSLCFKSTSVQQVYLSLYQADAAMKGFLAIKPKAVFQILLNNLLSLLHPNLSTTPKFFK